MEELHPLAGFVYPEYLPEVIVADLLDDIDKQGIPFEVRKEPLQTYAAFEWVVPTLLFAWISKAYFESFIKEAGKDHYTMFKPWVINMVGKARALTVTSVTSSEATQKTDPSYSQSKAVSVIIQLKSGRMVKVLFDDQLTQQDWEEALGKMLDIVVEHYQEYPRDVISEQTAELSAKPHHMLYAVLDTTAKNWTLLDDRGMMQRERGR